MKFSVDQEVLDVELKLLKSAVAARTTLPVLGCIGMSLKDDTLSMAATDLDIGIASTITVDGKADGDVALPAKTLIDIISTLSKGKINFSLKKETLNMTITKPGHRSRVKGISADEFPPFPTVEYEGIGVSVLDFKIMVIQTSLAASTDQARPVLEGINVSTNDENKLTMAAADGFRLSVSELQLSENINGNKFAVVVPAPALVQASRIADVDEDTIFIGPTKDGNKFICQCGHRTLFSQLIEGVFPDFEQIIPTQQTVKATINSNAFRKALKLSYIFSREGGDVTRLSFNNEIVNEIAQQTLTVSGQSEETGDISNEIPDTVIEGKSLVVAFNSVFLLELMSIVKTDFITFEGNEDTTPGLFKAVGDDEFLHVIMPMHLENYTPPVEDGDAQEETNE